jgi:hypothetical protein
MTERLPELRTKLEQLLDRAYSGRITGAALGMLLGEISALRREITRLRPARMFGKRKAFGRKFPSGLKALRYFLASWRYAGVADPPGCATYH